MKKNNLYMLFCMLGLLSCQQEIKVNAGFITAGANVPYSLNQPDTTFTLEKSLREISGLSYNSDDDNLIGIQDEKGKLYFIDKASGRIQKELEFGKKDDYEGVEKVGDRIFIIESHGKIHEYILSQEKDAGNYGNDFDKDHDLEGLGYNKATNELLIASKKRGLDQKKSDISRIIYKVKLDNLEDIEELTKMDLSANFDSLTVQGLSKGPFFDFILMQRLRDFAPSSLAVRPKTGEIYVLSSKAGVLVTLDPIDYKVQAILFLKRSVHVQPEGMCFDDDDNLYISNEARGRPALLHVYHPDDNITVVKEGESALIKALVQPDTTAVDSAKVK